MPRRTSREALDYPPTLRDQHGCQVLKGRGRNDSYWSKEAATPVVRACRGSRPRDPRERLCPAPLGLRSRDVGPDDDGGGVECGPAWNWVGARDVVRGVAQMKASC